jgi:hypothetical protein
MMFYRVWRGFPGRVYLLALLAVLLLAACEPAEPLIPTRTRTLTGPTIEASPVVLPFPPTDSVEGYYGQNDPTAAALPGSGELPPLPMGGIEAGGQIVQITAEDGGLINGVLYQSGLVRQPGILFLATDYANWGTFPAKLAEAGFTVLSVSLRPDSGTGDISVLLRALSSGEADPGRLGMIGAGITADTAFLGCAAELLCDTVVLLSPTQHDVLRAALPAYNPRAIFTTASREDASAYATAQDLAAGATGEAVFQPFENAGSGIALIQNRPELADAIIQWFDRQFSD